jgi:hypothetical protein
MTIEMALTNAIETEMHFKILSSFKKTEEEYIKSMTAITEKLAPTL